MYLINSMKSYSIENIRIQDILLISICILLFLNRAVPIDYSSIWRVTVLCLIYTCIRIMPKRQCYCLLYIVCIWGITEVIISTLQKVNYLESNLIAILFLGKYAIRLLNDYRAQKKAGIQSPVFKKESMPDIEKDLECW